MADDFLVMVPIRGKYAQVGVDGLNYSIYRVNPASPEILGTKVPREIAVRMLYLTPPVVSILPVVDKDGQIVQQLTKDELAKIKEVSLANRPSAPGSLAPTAPLGGAADAETIKDLRTQLATATANSAELLKLVNSLKQDQDALRERVIKAEKSGKGKEKADD